MPGEEDHELEKKFSCDLSSLETMAEWEELRGRFKGTSKRSRFKAWHGSYDANSGTLIGLNDALSRYFEIRSLGHNLVVQRRLDAVHGEIDKIISTPKIEKYGLLLAELLVRIPARSAYSLSDEKTKADEYHWSPRQTHELFSRAQKSLGYRVFVDGRDRQDRHGLPMYGTSMAQANIIAWDNRRKSGESVDGPKWDPALDAVSVQYKLGFYAKLKLSFSSIRGACADAVRRETGSGIPIEKLDRLTRTLDDDDLLFQRGLLAMGKKLSMKNRKGGQIFDTLVASEDMMDLVQNPLTEILESRASDPSEITLQALHEGKKKALLIDPGLIADPNHPEAWQEAVCLVGMAFSFIDLAKGLMHLVQAGFDKCHASATRQLYPIVPFGSVSASVTAMAQLFDTYAKEGALVGALDVSAGVLGLAGLGPLGPLIATGIKTLVRLHLSLEDAEHVTKARWLLSRHWNWMQPLFVMKAIAEVPLFGAYLVVSAETSSLLGFLGEANADAYKDARQMSEHIQSQARASFGQIRDLKDRANILQRRAKWGFMGLAGWDQNLDSGNRGGISGAVASFGRVTGNASREFTRGGQAGLGGTRGLRDRFRVWRGSNGTQVSSRIERVIFSDQATDSEPETSAQNQTSDERVPDTSEVFADAIMDNDGPPAVQNAPELV